MYYMSIPSRGVSRAYKRGVAEGVRSVFRVQTSGRLAPKRIERETGSTNDDALALRRDSDRIFRDSRTTSA
jgi:hypothetical protein